MNIPAEKIYSVSIMPCTAKKFEATRSEMNASSYQDVDLVLTVRELSRLFCLSGSDFTKLAGSSFDSWMGAYTVAGVISASSGGVMEAIYAEDAGSELRKSHHNPKVKLLYQDYLHEPLGHISHELYG